jgi:hypothetical protein
MMCNTRQRPAGYGQIQVRLTGRFHRHFVNVTPNPVFAGFKRLDQWMLRTMEMFGGVLVFGRVAAADMAARQTQAQMHPFIAALQTFLTPCAGWRNILNLIEMRT